MDKLLPGTIQDKDDMVTTLPDGRPLVDNTGRPIKRKVCTHSRPQSCDFCRSRKTKCVRPDGEGSTPEDTRCSQCRTAGVPCTWSYIPKRPGPQTHLSGGSSSSKKAKQARVQSPESSASSDPLIPTNSLAGIPPSPQSASRIGSSGFPPSLASSSSRASNSDGFSEVAQMSSHFEHPLPNPYQAVNYGLGHDHPAGPQVSLPPLSHPNDTRVSYSMAPPSLIPSPLSSNQLPPLEWLPKGSPSPHQQQPSPQHTHPHHQLPYQQQHSKRFDISTNIPTTSQPSPLSSSHSGGTPRLTAQGAWLPSASSYGTTPDNTSFQPPRLLNDMRPSFGSDTGSAKASRGSSRLGKIFAAPIDRPRSIDDIAPRATFLSVVSLYFHHLYPLMPIVHQPSFSHDLITRRDERDDDFLSFVLSLTAYTLIQCPRSVIPAPWPFYRKLHQICHLTSRRMQLDRQSHGFEPNLTVCATLYTTHIYMGSTGRTYAANAVHGELVRTAYSINLHDETRPPLGVAGVSSTQPEATPQMTSIERQLRRRVAHLINGSDKTISILSDEPVSFPIAEWVGVDIPVAVDDDHIFPHKIGAQPSERGPSILCGFETVSKLHMIMGDLVENVRADRRRPPNTVEEARNKLRFASSILRRIQDVVNEMPGDLSNPSFEHTAPPPRPDGGLPDLGASSHSYHGGSSVGRDIDSQTNGSSGEDKGSSASSRELLAQFSLPFAPWPTGTFDENGLPIALEGGSQPSSSAAPSPTGWGPPATGGPTLGGSIATPFLPSGGANFSSPVCPTSDQLNAAREQVVAFRPSPPPVSTSQGSHYPILSGFAICRANILVTEAMLRFVLVDYRELLQGHLQRLRIESGEENADEEDDASKEIEEASRAFFSEAVATLPFDALAANGQSLILKLVFIVSTLLHRTSTSSKTYEFMSELLLLLTELTDRREEKPDEEGEQYE